MVLSEKFYFGVMNGIMVGFWGSIQIKVWAGRVWDKWIIGNGTLDWERHHLLLEQYKASASSINMVSVHLEKLDFGDLAGRMGDIGLLERSVRPYRPKDGGGTEG